MIFNATSRVRVRDAEGLWLAKFILRISTLLAGIIAIGCIAWAFAQYTGTYYDWALLPWQFITLGISIIWNLANIIVRLLRPRPMHPGANVGMDLVLWMGLITTGIIATFAGVQNLTFYDYSGTSTSTVENPDGTYSYVYGHYGYFQNGTYGFIPDGSPDADTTTINPLHHLGVVELVGCAFTFLAVLLHFTLFVWACVDVHRRNNGKVDRRAAAIAQTIIAEMAERGILPSGQQSQPQQHAAPFLAPEGIHMRDTWPYNPGSMPLGHPTDEGGPMGKRSYMPVETDEIESFPPPPRNHAMRSTASEDSIGGIERGAAA